MRLAGALLAMLATAAVADEGQIVVNAQTLSAEEVRQLQRIYPVEIKPGRYWYDKASGAWGVEGDGIAGQMRPGLKLGGPLREDASGGTSGVFFNGRQITMSERSFLERTCKMRTAPGRYWVNARGVGGAEGGPAKFNLARCGEPRPSTGPSTYCAADGTCKAAGLWGSAVVPPR